MRVIRGKRALVTGAASGIGRAIALRLAREGADLHLLDVDVQGARKIASLAKSFGVSASAEQCDVAQPAEITAATGGLIERWGGVDMLINNAGVAYYGPTLNMTADQWNKLLAINLHAPIQFTRELLPTLLARPEAHVVNVASICGLVAGARLTAYHVSKFGLVGFSEAIRAEFGRQGLGITALCPGPVRSNIYKSAMRGTNDQRKLEPPAWVCAQPERVAAKAIKAIYRDRRMVLVTPLAHLLYQTKRFVPGLLDAVQRVGRRKKIKAKYAKWLAGELETPVSTAAADRRRAA